MTPSPFRIIRALLVGVLILFGMYIMLLYRAWYTDVDFRGRCGSFLQFLMNPQNLTGPHDSACALQILPRP